MVFFSLSDERWQFELSSQYSEVCPLVDSRCDLVDNQDSHHRCLSSGSVCITGRALFCLWVPHIAHRCPEDLRDRGCDPLHAAGAVGLLPHCSILSAFNTLLTSEHRAIST